MQTTQCTAGSQQNFGDLSGSPKQKLNQGLYALAKLEGKEKTHKRVDTVEIIAWGYNVFDKAIRATFRLFILFY